MILPLDTEEGDEDDVSKGRKTHHHQVAPSKPELGDTSLRL